VEGILNVLPVGYLATVMPGLLLTGIMVFVIGRMNPIVITVLELQ
jgi:hypothetical protein